MNLKCAGLSILLVALIACNQNSQSPSQSDQSASQPKRSQLQESSSVPQSPGDDEINLVKQGFMTFDESITLGDALDKYGKFSKTHWQFVTSEQGRQIVECQGELKNEFVNQEFYSAYLQGELQKFVPNATLMDTNRINVTKVTWVFRFILSKTDDTFKLGPGSFLIEGMFENNHLTGESEMPAEDVLAKIYRNE